MKLFRFSFLLLIMCFSALANALDIELVETSPAKTTALNPDEALYVLIRYKSDQPIRFQAIGKHLGEVVSDSARLNPSQAYPAGEGEAIAWVSYSKPTEIEAVKVTVYDKNGQALQKKILPLSVHWQATNNGADQVLEPWVKRLNQQQQSSIGQEREPVSVFWNILIKLLFFSVPIYWILQIVLMIRWQGKWRKRSSLPLIISIPLLLYTLFAFYVGSNLWPLMMIFISPVLLIVLLIIMAIKMSTRKPE